MFGHHAGVLLVGPGGQFRETRLVISENQDMLGRRMLEVIVDAFLFTQPVDEVQIALVVLNAVLAWFVLAGQLEAELVRENPVLLEHRRDDVRYVLVLEDALIMPVGQILQLRHQRHSVARHALAGLALRRAVEQAVKAGTRGADLQEGGTVPER